MKSRHTFSAQRIDLIDSDSGGDESSRLLVVFESGETVFEPVRNLDTALPGKTLHLFEVLDGKYAQIIYRDYVASAVPPTQLSQSDLIGAE